MFTTSYLYSLSSLFILLGITFCQAQENDLIASGEKLHLVADGYSFTEGPASDKDGNVYFTDQPNDRILLWDAATDSVTTYMQPSGRSNGLYMDTDGSLLSTADEKTALWRIDSMKNVSVLINAFDNKKLNGPNDLWADPNGGIYITDSYYERPWWDHKSPEQTARRVYFLPKNGKKLMIAAENMLQPNGIIGTPDGKKLYVADIDDKKTYVFDIDKDGQLKNRKLFAEMGSDGMTIDNKGNVYFTGDGVTVLNDKGEKIAHIEVPQNWTANVTFGGPDEKTLFITASKAVYTLKMNVHGVRW
ncbi:SMP-30/gluconolactonase/LRE family protein [Flavimarina sp. Hel_I_48]|uniref:SMP-30/gluconolactonase/LRE family protein n=1 Tax=Flavimarina sp. Hel_I_48 TaxID=1392488 RepID=UPI0004DF1750|nr:SMP-30/gluconolactonase/LRE family protein [Flavimarina sp. Hel_I_48]